MSKTETACFFFLFVVLTLALRPESKAIVQNEGGSDYTIRVESRSVNNRSTVILDDKTMETAMHAVQELERQHGKSAVVTPITMELENWHTKERNERTIALRISFQ